jgi:hypothetical protein
VTIARFSDAVRIYTDQELLTTVGVPMEYVNRGEIIANIFNLLSENGFFILTQINPDRASNTRTTLMEEFNEIPSPYVVCGKLFQYIVYTLEELNAAFRMQGDEIEFTRPDRPNQSFNTDEIGTLNEILPRITRLNPDLETIVTEVRDKIVRGLITRSDRDRNTTIVHRHLREASREVKDQVKEIFMNIFYAGMYMRRWRGPGNPYPVTEAETLGRSDPQPQSILTLGHVSEGMEQLQLMSGGQDIRDLIETLRVVNVESGGEYTFTERNLFQYIGIIASGQSCIRMASVPLITSAYYYLLTFFQYVIPNVELTRLVTIS